MGSAKATTTVLATLGLVIGSPGTASAARTPCPDEQLPATATNLVQVTAAVDCLVTEQRARFGLPAFRRSVVLDTDAELHSVDMITRNYFSHTDPDGRTPEARAEAQGYTQGVGENIAFGYPNAAAVVQGWMASQGHCENILSSGKDLGIGLATAADGTLYATQVFGDFGDDTAAAADCPYADLDSPAPAGTIAAPAPAPAPVAAAPDDAAVPASDAAPVRASAVSVDPKLRVKLRVAGQHLRIKGRLVGLRGASPLKLRVAGRTLQATAHDGRFSVKLPRSAARETTVRLSSPPQAGINAFAATLRLHRG